MRVATKKRTISRKDRQAKRQAVQQHDTDHHSRGYHGTSSAKKRPRKRLITDYLSREPPPKRKKQKNIVDDIEIVKDGSETKS